MGGRRPRDTGKSPTTETSLPLPRAPIGQNGISGRGKANGEKKKKEEPAVVAGEYKTGGAGQERRKKGGRPPPRPPPLDSKKRETCTQAQFESARAQAKHKGPVQAGKPSEYGVGGSIEGG